MTMEERLSLLEQNAAAQVPTPTEYYPRRWSGEEIDKGISGALQLGGATTPQAALRYIGGRPNRNLLDNAYLKGGGSQQGGGQFPINQRGQTSYSGNAGHFIDRWLRNQNVNVTINANGLTITPIGTDNPTIFQIVADSDAFFGKEVTISVLMTNGNFFTATGTYSQKTETAYSIAEVSTEFGNVRLQYQPGSGPLFVLDGSNQVAFTLLAAKLELGPTQTLAYQDEDGNWQLFETPDYAEELAKCQRYLQIFGQYDAFVCIGSGASYTDFMIPLSTPFRAHPVVLTNGGLDGLGVGWYNRGNLIRMRISNRTGTIGEEIGFSSNCILSAEL